jgi:hypothetical protein
MGLCPFRYSWNILIQVVQNAFFDIFKQVKAMKGQGMLIDIMKKKLTT